MAPGSQTGIHRKGSSPINCRPISLALDSHFDRPSLTVGPPEIQKALT